MAIIGIGTDLCDIRRIEAGLARFGARYGRRLLTANEQHYILNQSDSRHGGEAAALARRFAAKEAVAKALGTGIGHGSGIFWRDIEVLRNDWGQPRVRLHGAALQRLLLLLPEAASPAIHLSLSDEYPHALAFVVIETLHTTASSAVRD